MPFGNEQEKAEVEESGSSDPQAKLTAAKSALDELSSIFESSKSVSDKDKGRLEGIKTQFEQLEASLNMEPGTDPEDAVSKPTGRLSPEAGNKAVKPTF